METKGKKYFEKLRLWVLMEQFVNLKAFGMAEMEMEYRVELFNRLSQTCFSKCVDKRFKESELNMGENSCIDLCVSKYWLVNGLIGEMLNAGQRPM